MSSKSAKRSASGSSSSAVAGPSHQQTPPSSVSSRVQTPITPTRLSRIQEKKELVSLNDRLAAYIDRNQQLENENDTLHKQVEHAEEAISRNTTRIQQSYDKELTDTRRIVDETAKEKAKMQVALAQLKKDFDDVKGKFDKKNKDATQLQKQVEQLEGQVTSLTADLSRASNRRDRLCEERKELCAELKRLGAEVVDLKRRLEQETMARVVAENQLKNGTEQLTFKNRLLEQEIVEARTQRYVEMQEVDGRLQQEYEMKLQESIRELRAEYEGQLQANKQELEVLYDTKVSDLKKQLNRAQSSSAAKQEELANAQVRLEGALKASSQIEQERATLQNKIKELETKSDGDHCLFAKMLEDRDNNIDNLAMEKEQLLNEYHGLMDTKVALDNELATYRTLLDGEEKRLMATAKRRRGNPT